MTPADPLSDRDITAPGLYELPAMRNPRRFVVAGPQGRPRVIVECEADDPGLPDLLDLLYEWASQPMRPRLRLLSDASPAAPAPGASRRSRRG